MKKVLAILMSFCLALSLCACNFVKDIADMAASDKAVKKTFEFEGISMELTTDFLRMDFVSEDYEFVVGDENIAIFGMKIDFEESDLSNYSALEFAKYFRDLMSEDNPTEVAEVEGIPSMQYASTEDGEEQTIILMFYKASDCFWILGFGVSFSDYEEFYPEIKGYAKTVKCD